VSRASVRGEGRPAGGPVREHVPTGQAAGEVPPGWDYNPSAWSDRLPIAGLALLGFCVACYLALYQYGVVPSVWEPFFGHGSEVVLHSWISDSLRRLLGLPITDAALGATGYACDAIGGLVGGPRRWRTRPWLVLLFGFVVGPLGAVSVALVILQPTVLGAWCTLCLTSAAISVSMIGPAMDEVLATLQHLRRERDAGAVGVACPLRVTTARKGGCLMWARLLSVALGVWLMAAPAVLGYGGAAATNDRIVGPLAAALSVVALFEVTRPLRWLALPLGLWLLAAPLALEHTAAATCSDLLTGAALVALAPLGGRVRSRFGGGWSALWGGADRAA